MITSLQDSELLYMTWELLLQRVHQGQQELPSKVMNVKVMLEARDLQGHASYPDSSEGLPQIPQKNQDAEPKIRLVSLSDPTQCLCEPSPQLLEGKRGSEDKEILYRSISHRHGTHWIEVKQKDLRMSGRMQVFETDEI